MKNFNEISKKIMYNEDEGMGCGPVDITAIDAEIVIEDNGEKIYLHGQWVDTVGNSIYFEATKASTYDIYEKLNRGEGDFDALIAERNRIDEEESIKDEEKLSQYETFYEELKNMILEEMNSRGIECSLNCDDDEE